MPKRTDIHKILIIGSGPIIIGQACEFDYSGTQACKSLRDEGYEVVLVNSNPATIMTDPELADRTYIEPLTKEYLEEIIKREKPDAVLPTVGGQTGLNLAVELAETGILDKYGVKLIGASLRAIKIAEDRLWFKDACRKAGLDVPESALVNSVKDAMTVAEKLGYPLVIRPSFTLGGFGGGIVYNREEFTEAIARALDASPVHETLIEESVEGWKEFELEVMRDKNDNFVVICSIETWTPWACTRAIPSPSPPRRPSPTRNTSACAMPPPRSSAKLASKPAARMCSSPWTRPPAAWSSSK